MCHDMPWCFNDLLCISSMTNPVKVSWLPILWVCSLTPIASPAKCCCNVHGKASILLLPFIPSLPLGQQTLSRARDHQFKGFWCLFLLDYRKMNLWVAKIIQELWSWIGLGKPMVVWMFWGSPVSKTPMVCWVGGGKPSSPVCPVCMATAFASRFPAVVLTCGPLLWMPQCDVKGTVSRIWQCTRFARMVSDGNDSWQLLRFLMNTHDNSRAPMSQSDFGCWGFLSSFQPSCSTEAWLICLSPLVVGHWAPFLNLITKLRKHMW